MTEKIQVTFTKEDIVEALEDYYKKVKGEEYKINISFDPNDNIHNQHAFAYGITIYASVFTRDEKELEGTIDNPTALKMRDAISTTASSPNIWYDISNTTATTIDNIFKKSR